MGSLSLTDRIIYCLHAAQPTQSNDSKLRLIEPPFDEHAFLQPYWMPSLHGILWAAGRGQGLTSGRYTEYLALLDCVDRLHAREG